MSEQKKDISDDPNINDVIYAVAERADGKGNVLTIGCTRATLNRVLVQKRGTLLVRPPIQLNRIEEVVIFFEETKDDLRKTYAKLQTHTVGSKN